MKKKMEALMQDSRLHGNTAFEQLQKGYQSAEKNAKNAKDDKDKAKSAYHHAADAGKKDRDTVMRLRVAFRQAKYMQHYHRAAFELAEYQLVSWLESWSDGQKLKPAERKKRIQKRPGQPQGEKRRQNNVLKRQKRNSRLEK